MEKTEHIIRKKLLKRALRENRYVKKRPGEMVHIDSSVMPLVPGEAMTTPKEYLHVFIDDCSRTLFAECRPFPFLKLHPTNQA